MRREARAIVPTRRRHPSLALWCGGNELAGKLEGRSDDVPLDDAHPVLGALHDVVRELDPGRAWLPTSPSGPRFLNRLDVIAEDPDGQHDVHGPWEHQGLRAHYALYDAGTAILHSEFGVEGMTNRAAHEQLIDAAAPLARRPQQPGLRASRRVVEQRAARAGVLRRPDRRPRDAAACVAVAAIRRPALRRRGEHAARSLGRRPSLAVQRVVPECVVHGGGRLARRAEARVLGRGAGLSTPSTRARSSQRVRGVASARCARRSTVTSPRGSSTSTARSSPSRATRSPRLSTSSTMCSCSTSQAAIAT